MTWKQKNIAPRSFLISRRPSTGYDDLLFKIKRDLQTDFYTILKSYFMDRTFLMKQGGAVTQLYPIHFGVPQGSVLGSIPVSIISTADLSTICGIETATFADDIAIFAAHKSFRLKHLRYYKKTCTWSINGYKSGGQ